MGANTAYYVTGLQMVENTIQVNALHEGEAAEIAKEKGMVHITDVTHWSEYEERRSEVLL